ncbi:MAG TPA: tyrosine--tRNA ligase [Chloroflexota bacterium]|nr:tyrosine--tRNA ligase [Chloroflexota bacterium]
MRFSLSADVLQQFPDICVGVVVAHGAQNHGRDERLTSRLQEAAALARQQIAGREFSQVPQLAIWRERFRQIGIDPDQHPASIEALARRAQTGSPPSISKAVDIANIVSLGHLVPAGAHDVDRLVGDFRVRLSRDGDTFTPMGRSATEQVPAGEFVYADEAEVRTRRWVWRQGEHAKVTADSRTIFFPIDGFVGATDEAVRAAAAELSDLAREILGAETTVAFLDATSPSVDVEIQTRESDEIDRILTRAVAEILPSRAELERRLRAGDKIRIYYGVDPTSPIIHIGHAVPIRKLRQLQDLGCQIVILIGDFTGRIGDPTDKSATRVQLTPEQVEQNAQTYRDQIAKILDFDSPTNPVELRYNGEWWDNMTAKDMIEQAAVFTVQQMLQRDMFQNRFTENRPIGLHEFFYPLLQGYDSVALNVDAEIGGTDQTFNMLAGRTLVRALQNREKIVITCPLLEGTDGRKMSKSFGNTIGVTDPPYEMYGRVMSMSDDLIPQYFELCTDVPDEEIAEIRCDMAVGRADPMNLKKRLAWHIVTQYHREDEARIAGERFEREVQRKELPEEMPIVTLDRAGEWGIVDLLLAANLAGGRNEAKRLVEQGSVVVDQQKLTDPRATISIHDGTVVRARKRSFARITVR